ncbi:MAG: tRNA (adenosine(37)-N6)-threonylcarbamoyltransferase complex dimerization subunit type 1 TsaB [Firmicutes bacterium]|nr:tRNA (adenosine(37)-N6)-threonylcarbamoyltransferase complex dimerization subunit type 1 TsaB [Bacillota bacterium]
MNVLYIDTTTSDLVVALVQNNEIVSVSQRAMGVKHSETLCNKVEELLKTAQITFNGLDAYACAVGPGSFTGIRIGISTVKGYATAVPKPYISVNCLEAIARSRNCHGNGFSVIDAGNGYYYYSSLEGTRSNVVPYDDETVKNCSRASGACDYLDGAAQIIRDKYLRGNFDCSLTPVYIRRSQAEITLEERMKHR